MNDVFYKYMHSKTTLNQFIEQHKNALRDKREKERRAVYESFNNTIPCVFDYDIEKHFQCAYTNSKFW